MVITVRVANNNVHLLLVMTAVSLTSFYLNMYKRMRLTESELSPTTSPLYGFTGYHVFPIGTVKLAMIVGKHPRVLTVVVEFLVVYCPSSIHGIIGTPFLKALKVVTSIYHLTMKFQIAKGMRQVRGSQYYSRECYNKSLKLAEKERKLP